MSGIAASTIHSDIDKCMRSEQHALRRRLRNIGKKSSDKSAADLEALRLDITAAIDRYQQRVAAVPAPDYPEQLPVVQHREEIIEAIKNNPVTIICGETGSGKTTQIPKMCLQAGLGINGMIGHTQPRRICLLYTSPSPRDLSTSRMPSSA